MTRLLLKIIKSSSGLVDYESEPCAIDNTVIIPQTEQELQDIPDEETAEAEPVNNSEKLAEEERAELERMRAELEEKAASVISEAEKTARARADEIIAQAYGEAVEIRKKAEEEGYAKGEADGTATVQKYIHAAAELLSQIDAKKEAYFISHKDELLETSCYMAEKIVAAQLSVDKNTILGIIAQAAKTFRSTSYLKISLAKGEISEKLAADKEFLKSVVGNIPEIEVELLPDAVEGTVVLDNGSEIVDASVPTQLDFLREIMENSKTKHTAEE